MGSPRPRPQEGLFVRGESRSALFIRDPFSMLQIIDLKLSRIRQNYQPYFHLLPFHYRHYTEIWSTNLCYPLFSFIKKRFIVEATGAYHECKGIDRKTD